MCPVSVLRPNWMAVLRLTVAATLVTFSLGTSLVLSLSCQGLRHPATWSWRAPRGQGCPLGMANVTTLLSLRARRIVTIPPPRVGLEGWSQKAPKGLYKNKHQKQKQTNNKTKNKKRKKTMEKKNH